MEETKIPLFKKLDRYLFDQIDKFKQTPNYAPLNDFYNGLEEEQQRVFKGAVILVLFLLPMMFLSLVLLQNSSLRDELKLREGLVQKAQQIISEGQGIASVAPAVLAQSPIDEQSMMTTRMSGLFGSISVDLSKIQISNFTSTSLSSTVMRSEADFTFNNLSTDELVNIFTAMIQREKFRIESVEILRNADSNLLQGKFHGIHFSLVTESGEE